VVGADGSGELEEPELKQLFARMDLPTDKRAMQRELVQFEFTAFAVGVQAAPSTMGQVLARLRGMRRSAAAFHSAGGSLRRPGTHGAAAAAGARAVSKVAFERWFRNKCTAAVEDPYDVLYGTTDSRAYYWFAQVEDAPSVFQPAAEPSH
jgi:hypothetical protein